MKKILLILLLSYNIYGKDFVQEGFTNSPNPKTTEEILWEEIQDNKYALNIVDIHDGDTIKADILLSEFNITLNKQILRAKSYDAYELTKVRHTVTVTDEEIKLGLLARNYVRDLSKKYTFYIVSNGSRDVYGRILVEIWLSDVSHKDKYLNLGKLMQKNNFIRK